MTYNKDIVEVSGIAHSSVGASSAHRWMNCPASATLSKQVVKTSSTFADEGTAAHELAERCLTSSSKADAFLGSVITVNDTEYEVNLEMVKAVNSYLDIVEGFAFHCTEDEVLVDNYAPIDVEIKFNLNWLEHGMFGTCDAVVRQENRLHIVDLKYGAGKPVYADNNPQLMYYALGALGQPRGDLPEIINLVIVQPRCETSGITQWEISTEELYDWAYNVLRPAVRATREPNPKVVFGEWCHWCPAVEICPKMAEIVGEITELDLYSPPNVQTLDAGNVQTLDAGNVQTLNLPKVENLSLEKKAWIAENKKLVSSWMNAVEESVTKAAMSGAKIQGYKLVQKKMGNRRWVNPKTVKTLYGGILGDKLYEEPKMISPAGLERALAEAEGLAKPSTQIKDDVTRLTERYESGLELRPDSDKRPAVELSDRNKDLFDDYGDEL